MKRILVAIFAIWTFAMFGQNVNPETFPTVSGSIQDKNLYTNTSGEGKISIKTIWDSVKITDTVSTTYADFYTLITGGNLQVGKTYILIDFQTIYDQMDFDASGNLKSSLTTKTGAIEEIWVLALAPDRIASTAYSKTYPNDRIQYDWTYNATLVNGSPAKGRISERIDERNNRTDYDHREIKFIRYDDGAGNFTIINDNGNASAEFLTFNPNADISFNNYIGDYYILGQFIGQEFSNNVFNGNVIFSNKFGVFFINNTFMGDVQDCNFNSTVSYSVFNNSVRNSSVSGNISYTNFYNYISYSIFSGDVQNCNFNDYVSECTFNGYLQYSDFDQSIYGVEVSGSISNKSFTNILYPFLFNNSAKKEIFSIINNDVYARYFDGTNDINVLIP